MTPFVGEQLAPALDSVLMMLSLLPPATLWEAVRKVDHAETLGPLVDPSAWQGGAFARSRKWGQLFEHLAGASEILHEAGQ